VYKGHEVHHKDADKGNNHLSNLEWVTHAENMRRMKEMGLAVPHSGGANGRAKLSRIDVVEMRLKCLAGNTTAAIAREHGVSRSQAKRAIFGEQWKEAA